ncbi:MAG: hypothetical protein ACLGSD_14530 [Acidobacteriota bacterium]
MDQILQQVGDFLLGSVPTALLFIAVVLAYQFLVQGPLSRTLRERHARTEGAVEEAHKAIARAEERAAEYAAKLRHARSEIYKAREQRVKQWTAERDTQLDEARKSAGAKVREAKTQMEGEADKARQTLQASAGELASRIARAVLPQTAGGTH